MRRVAAIVLCATVLALRPERVGRERPGGAERLVRAGRSQPTREPGHERGPRRSRVITPTWGAAPTPRRTTRTTRACSSSTSRTQLLPRSSARSVRPTKRIPARPRARCASGPSRNLLIVMTLFSNCGEIHACSPVNGEDRFNFYDISGRTRPLRSSSRPTSPPTTRTSSSCGTTRSNRGARSCTSPTPRGQEKIIVTDISERTQGQVHRGREDVTALQRVVRSLA